jgi:hypothetical protein
MGSLEALFRLPYMSLQFPGFVVRLAETRRALKGHGYKSTPVSFGNEWVSNRSDESVWMFDFSADVDVPFKRHDSVHGLTCHSHVLSRNLEHCTVAAPIKEGRRRHQVSEVARWQ